jgi:hypothetical protein
MVGWQLTFKLFMYIYTRYPMCGNLNTTNCYFIAFAKTTQKMAYMLDFYLGHDTLRVFRKKIVRN